MKVEKIEKEGYSIYKVHLVPSKIEKFFGAKPEIVRYKDTGDTYRFGGQTAYLKENGQKCGNDDWIAQQIDMWRNKF